MHDFMQTYFSFTQVTNKQTHFTVFLLSWNCFCAMAGPLLGLQEVKKQKQELESLTENVFLVGVVFFLCSSYFTHLTDIHISIFTAFYLCQLNAKERNL